MLLTFSLCLFSMILCLKECDKGNAEKLYKSGQSCLNLIAYFCNKFLVLHNVKDARDVFKSRGGKKNQLQCNAMPFLRKKVVVNPSKHISSTESGQAYSGHVKDETKASKYFV